MLPNLDIRIRKEENQTYTQFGKKKFHTEIVFHNQDEDDVLKVWTFLPAGAKDDAHPDAVLCQGGVQKPYFEVPKSAKMKFTLCDGFAASGFRYKAQVGTSLPEDPIIIIENSFLPEALGGTLLVAAVGAGFGVAARHYAPRIGAWLKGRVNPRPAGARPAG